jgi:hypothetical protein
MKQWLIIVNLAMLVGLPTDAQKASPEIHSNRTVTFQVHAPNTTNVMFALESSESKPMEKGERHVERHRGSAATERLRVQLLD